MIKAWELDIKDNKWIAKTVIPTIPQHVINKHKFLIISYFCIYPDNIIIYTYSPNLEYECFVENIVWGVIVLEISEISVWTFSYLYTSSLMFLDISAFVFMSNTILAPRLLFDFIIDVIFLRSWLDSVGSMFVELNCVPACELCFFCVVLKGSLVLQNNVSGLSVE